MFPVTPTTLYFGTYRLYRTTNEGTSWTAISGDLTKGTSTGGTITAIAPAPSDPSTIYVGTSDGYVQVSRNGGATFTLSNNQIPNRYVSDIAVDPADATHAILTVSGFQSGHVWETRSAGATWTNVSGTLPDIGVNAAVFITGSSTIMIGTDAGVYQTSSGGSSWSVGPAGLPNAIVYDLLYHPASKLLVAGTYGRGMWGYTVDGEPVVLRGDVNADGQVNSFDALLVQQALASAVSPSTAIYPRGDANCNGTIDAADVLLIMRASVGLSTSGACVGQTR